MSELRILTTAEKGYDKAAANERIEEYRSMLVGLMCGGLSDEEVRERVEKLRSAPIPVCDDGYEEKNVDIVLEDMEKQLLMYNASGFAMIKRVRCGYRTDDVLAKVFAYNELIDRIGGGMDKNAAADRLTEIRHMPLAKEKYSLFFKNSYAKAETDEFIAALDHHLSDLIT